jgi:hypothetical protein
MTLAQFKAAVQLSVDTRDQIDDHMRYVTMLTAQRDYADVEAMRLVEGVSHGVRGNPKFGQDSLLYGQMGYVRKSARRKRRSKRGARCGCHSSHAGGVIEKFRGRVPAASDNSQFRRHRRPGLLPSANPAPVRMQRESGAHVAYEGRL